MPTEAELTRNQLRISCADALELMTHHLDRALSIGDRERFDAHLGGCEACAVYLDQLELTVGISGTVTGDDQFVVDRATMDSLVEIYKAHRDPE